VVREECVPSRDLYSAGNSGVDDLRALGLGESVLKVCMGCDDGLGKVGEGREGRGDSFKKDVQSGKVCSQEARSSMYQVISHVNVRVASRLTRLIQIKSNTQHRGCVFIALLTA